MRETSRDYAHPYRPWLLRAAHTLTKPFWGMVSLEPSNLIAAAQKAEGLTDFGEPSLEPLELLMDAIHREADLHLIGRIATRTRLLGTLQNRLRMVQLRKDHPEMAELPIKAPVVITGLQRTGTTFLHRLMAADPRHRALRSWEALQPAPPKGKDTRVAHAESAEKALSWMAPDFFAVHPVQADGYEEEVLLLDYSFLSTVPEATLRVPTFSAWLEQQDQRPAYTMLRQLLQLLSWQEEGRWVLKTPHHLEWLDVLLAEFPDAKIVHTHRDPAQTLPSFCSMVAHGRGVMSDSVDPMDIGREWQRKTQRMVSNALAARDQADASAFHDVRYEDLVADPLATVEKVYGFLGTPFDATAEAAVRNAIKNSPKHRFGKHVYDGADFGLTRASIRAGFADYIQRFDL